MDKKRKVRFNSARNRKELPEKSGSDFRRRILGEFMNGFMKRLGDWNHNLKVNINN